MYVFAKPFNTEHTVQAQHKDTRKNMFKEEHRYCKAPSRSEHIKGKPSDRDTMCQHPLASRARVPRYRFLNGVCIKDSTSLSTFTLSLIEPQVAQESHSTVRVCYYVVDLFLLQLWDTQLYQESLQHAICTIPECLHLLQAQTLQE